VDITYRGLSEVILDSVSFGSETEVQGFLILAVGVVPYMDSSSVCKHSVLWQ